MNSLRYENTLLQYQVGILARHLDPYHWEAIIRESGIQAADEMEHDLKDARTSPALRAETKLCWTLNESAKVFEKVIR